MNNEEPSQKDILALIKQINQSKQPYILYEQNITSKITDVIRDETNAEPVSFNNLSVLSKEQANDKDLTFQSIMKKNIKALDKALIKISPILLLEMGIFYTNLFISNIAHRCIVVFFETMNTICST